MVTKPGELYVGRLPQIQRGVANIHFAVDEMKKVQPHANYDKLTMVGHSMGGDISMYFAKEYPDQIKKVVTLDNLRVPFMTDAKFKILSFRSKDTQFKPDPGVVPDAEQCEKSGITVVDTGIPAQRHARHRSGHGEGLDPDHARQVPERYRQRARAGRYQEAEDHRAGLGLVVELPRRNRAAVTN